MANKLGKKKSTIQKVVKKVKPVVGGSNKQASKMVSSTFSLPAGEYLASVGRRKTATARVRLYKQAGDFVVNNKIVGEYFGGIQNASARYNLPLVTTDLVGKYAISVKVNGSGLAAQLDAVNHGVARALVQMNPELRLVLKQAGLLVRDDRMKETRKMGTGGKARRAKQSPKR